MFPEKVSQASDESPVHSLLKAEWKSLLPYDEIDDDANFYNLGGTSLIALTLLKRLQQLASPRLRLTDLLRCAKFSDQVQLITDLASDHLSAEATAPAPVVSSVQAFRLEPARREIREAGIARMRPIAFVLRLDGVVNIDHLADAVRELVCRHESLRTSFIDDHDNIAVEVRPLPADWRPRIEDLRHLHSKASWDWIWTTIKDVTAKGIDLRESPLALAMIGTISDDEFFVAIIIDHVAADGTSLSILRGDLAELYAAKCEARAPRLPELLRPAQEVLTDITREMSAESDKRLADWRRLLRGYQFPPSFELLPPQLLEGSNGYRGPAVIIKRTLGKRLMTQFDQTTREIGTSAVSAFVGITYLAAHVVSGASDICIICPNMCRDSLDAQYVVNCFVDPMIVRITDVFAGKPCGTRIRSVVAHAAACIAESARVVMPFNAVLEAIDTEAEPINALNGGPMRPWLWCNYIPSGNQSAPFCDVTATLVEPKIELIDFPNVRLYWDRFYSGLNLSVTAPQTYRQTEVRNLRDVAATLFRACATDPDATAAKLRDNWKRSRCTC